MNTKNWLKQKKSTKTKIKIPLTLGNRSLKTFALLSPDVEEVMLGIDWLRENKILGFLQPKAIRWWATGPIAESERTYTLPPSMGTRRHDHTTQRRVEYTSTIDFTQYSKCWIRGHGLKSSITIRSVRWTHVTPSES